MKTVVIKIGTNVITTEEGLLDTQILSNLVEQISELKTKDISPIIISSGAMGAGRALIKLKEKTNDITKRQVLASIGQVELIHKYLKLFQEHDLICAQVLATKEDFKGRQHYLNMKNCFEGLIQNNIIPIVNENDVVSVDELMFTDNDELAGLIASMMDADELILLTSIDGIYDRPPHEEGAALIQSVKPGEKVEQFISAELSKFGRGGMLTKARIAEKLATMGIYVTIANGRTNNILQKIIEEKAICTKFFPATNKKKSSLKRWIAHSEGQEKGVIYINERANEILRDSIASLLPVGITKINGEFEKGDIIKIKNHKDNDFGYGIASYSSETAKKYMGKKNKKALIHYDHLVIL